MTPTDTELLHRYSAQRSEAAFAELVQRYIDVVYHTALRQSGGRRDVAEDITQAVFVLVAQKAGRLQGHEMLAGWLHTATRYVAKDHRRAEARRLIREREANAMHDDPRRAEVEWDRVRPVLDDALSELKPADREAVLLRYFMGISLAEVGARLSVSENAARMRIDRALERLRARLARRGVTSTTTALGAVLANSAAAGAPANLASSITIAALSGTATGTGGAGLAGLLISMNNTKVIVGLAAALSMGGVGTSLWQAATVREVESALANVSRERDALQARLGAIEKGAQAPDQIRAGGVAPSRGTVANGATESGVGSAATRATKGATTAPAVQQPAKSSILQMLNRNPAFRDAELQRQRANMGLKYGPFYRSLRLSSGQIAEFEDAMCEWLQTNMETTALAAEQGLRETDPKLAGLVKPAMDSLTARLRSAIGEEGLMQLGPYEQSSDAHETISLLAGNLYYTDVPLSAAQAEQLIRIVAANTGQMKVTGIVGKPRELNWETILTQAQGVLAPVQLATLQRLADRSRYQRMVEALASGAEVEASGVPTADSSSGVTTAGGG
ncbi:RNA polymerase sigma factor [Opitutus terrae]|uniref:RNA polymerase, sigma-24 subunit, ECF subfamily n=1 Tax=Opitutus terrae (strain DSM 11246 / JCM 15787 / PB90-1) TaxID=452637 RepID=B1ZRE0_OPITP|nr:sigma-70 family RNA polymerase sigma factor [Opitutus terrae]ACB74627.1 RNA polymerase, sigma-24 subunit, ECF subfamily [Opitutus terrae PB90-1]